MICPKCGKRARISEKTKDKTYYACTNRDCKIDFVMVIRPKK